MSVQEIYQLFTDGMRQTTLLEYIAVLAGIASVWFSRKEKIWVYPVGLVNTIIYVWISWKGQLPGEAAVNFYYTVMSIYGWWIWAKKDQQQQATVRISFSDTRWWWYQLLFFSGCYVTLYAALQYMQQSFAPGAIPWADGLASAAAFTGMWLMAKKKVESWYWWMITNIASIPLYFVKHYVFTSVYYTVLLVMAVYGLYEWKKKALSQ